MKTKEKTEKHAQWDKQIDKESLGKRSEAIFDLCMYTMFALNSIHD